MGHCFLRLIIIEAQPPEPNEGGGMHKILTYLAGNGEGLFIPFSCISDVSELKIGITEIIEC